MITIENDHFKASISPMGAELRSLYDKATDREIIWEGDPSVWEGSAPILFPFVGTLPNGRTVINGEVYEMPMHGLVRIRNAEVIEQGVDRAVFAFSSDDETLVHYPFPFLLKVEFKLENDGLSVRYGVHNPASEEMLFSIGSHPALALDLHTSAIEDYFLEFEKPETLDLYGMSNRIFALKQAGYLADENQISLSKTLFDQGVLIFKDIRSGVLRLKSKHVEGSVEVDLGGAPHLGLWARPAAPYVCVEPWYSHDEEPDSEGIFENRPGIMRLPAGDTFETGYAIRVKDGWGR